MLLEKKENVNDMDVMKCQILLILTEIDVFPTGEASRPGWTDIITTVTVAKMAHFRIVNC